MMKKLILFTFCLMTIAFCNAQSNKNCYSNKKEFQFSLDHHYFSENTIGLYQELISKSYEIQKFSKFSLEKNVGKVQDVKFKRKNIKAVNLEKENDFLNGLFKSDCAIKLDNNLLIVQNNLKVTDQNGLNVLSKLLGHSTAITQQTNDLLVKIRYFLVLGFSVSGASGGFILVPLEEKSK